MPSAQELLQLEFEDVAKWRLGELPGRLAFEAKPHRHHELAAMIKAPSALYAFVHDDTVLYIGKTARTIAARFMGYRFPGTSQATNMRCNERIRAILDIGQDVDIYILVPTSSLQWGPFSLDLAAGLEEALILHFRPSWNGGGSKSESAEVEEEATGTEPDNSTTPPRLERPVATFQVNLGPTYYDKGMLNPGAEASRHLAPAGTAISIDLEDGQTIVSTINRTANSNGSVRIIGGNRAIAEWFQAHFSPGDTVQGQVIGPSQIRLLLGSAT